MTVAFLKLAIIFFFGLLAMEKVSFSYKNQIRGFQV